MVMVWTSLIAVCDVMTSMWSSASTPAAAKSPTLDDVNDVPLNAPSVPLQITAPSSAMYKTPSRTADWIGRSEANVSDDETLLNVVEVFSRYSVPLLDATSLFLLANDES